MPKMVVEPMLVYVYVALYKRPQTQPNLSIKADTVLPGWANWSGCGRLPDQG